MDNQHRKISGYRELSQTEIELMNKIKSLGPMIEEVLNVVTKHIDRQCIDAAPKMIFERDAEYDRLDAAEPERWVGVAKTNLQQGLMALTRAVAQPTFF